MLVNCTLKDSYSFPWSKCRAGIPLILLSRNNFSNVSSVYFCFTWWHSSLEFLNWKWLPIFSNHIFSVLLYHTLNYYNFTWCCLEYSVWCFHCTLVSLSDAIYLRYSSSSNTSRVSLAICLSGVSPKDTLQIFFAVLFWMSLFFWSCAWDRGNNGRPNKGSRFRKWFIKIVCCAYTDRS